MRMLSNKLVTNLAYSSALGNNWLEDVAAGQGTAAWSVQ